MLRINHNTFQIANWLILTAQTESIDWRGNIARESTYLKADTATKWSITESPTSIQPAIQKEVAGYPVMDISYSGVTNSYTYDALARQTSITDGRGNTSITVYDALGQVAYIEDGASNRTSFTYDIFGRRISVSDPLTNTVHTAYDSIGNVIAQWGATYPVQYSYDTQGRMVSMSTTRDNNSWDTTSWLYDATTRLLIQKLYADGQGVSYNYHLNNKLATRTWARGITTDYTYDNLGQLTNIQYSDTTPDISFEYDRMGRNMSAIVDGVATNLFVYNGLDLVSETQNGVIINRVTDNLGRVAGISLAELPYNIDYQYDAYGRFSSVTSSVYTVSSVANYMRLSGSDLIAGCTQGDLTRVINYEPNRDLTASIENHFGTSLISSFDYQNNATGQRIQRIDNSSVTNSFGFNSRQEIVDAMMGDDDYGYGYDSIGNRQWSSLNLATNLYTANNLNQYTTISVPQYEPQYDLDGSILYDGSEWHYNWNGENRLVCASNNTHVVEYAYDHQGRMVRKEVATTGSSLMTTQYLWDDYNIINETIQNQQSTITNHYVWGLDLSGSLQGAGGVGGLLAEIRNGIQYFPCFDANGNVTEYVDVVGAVRGHYEYSPFGEIISQSGDLATSFAFRFSTKYYDAETYSYYYGYRHYIPQYGCWLSIDPVGEIGGINQYGFVDNNPVNSIDYIGALTINISNLRIINNDDSVLAGAIGRYAANESLHCDCVKTTGNKAVLQCTLTAKPVVYLHSSKELLDLMSSQWNGQTITVLQHEINHHNVFINVYIPSYEYLVALYENKECCNCTELNKELTEHFNDLRSLLRLWEHKQEYFSGNKRQPFLDYGSGDTIIRLKKVGEPLCK